MAKIALTPSFVIRLVAAGARIVAASRARIDHMGTLLKMNWRSPTGKDIIDRMLQSSREHLNYSFLYGKNNAYSYNTYI